MKSGTSKTAILALTTVALTGAYSLFANSVLIDRGLPTANLNDPAGANRANIAFAAPGYTVNDYTVLGDTFVNTSASVWSIDTIRLWAVSPLATVALWGGIDGSGVYGLTAGTISAATYAVNDANGHNTFQAAGVVPALYYDLWQLDFTVNVTLAPGQTYDFFLDGTGNTALDPLGNALVVPYLHGSNAALSGSPQEGSDGMILSGDVVNGSLDVASITSYNSSQFWDKAFDFNVQVFGTVPDAGSTLLLLGSALGGLAMLRRRFQA